MKTILMSIALIVVSAVATAAEPMSPPALPATSPSPAGAAVYFIEPLDGATVTPTFTVKFGLRGMGVAPAGTDVPNTGHHHLLVDVADLPDAKLPLPANERFLHFGKGQTETQVTLARGTHTLQLVVGNYLHIPHDPPVMSKSITVTVE
jgi:hypothetical protein